MTGEPVSASVGAGGAPHRVPAVEGLRAMAALIVVFFHLSRVVGLTHPGLISSGATYWIARLGPFGVGVFFVLSGYLLYLPFVGAALQSVAPPRLGRYYARRFARIFPAYWVAVATYLFIVGPDQVRNAGDAFVFFGLIQNYRTGSLLLGLGIAWTLVIEVSFYVVLPALAWILRGRKDRRPEAMLRRQLVGLGVMYLIGIATRVWAFWGRQPGVGRLGAWQPFLLPEKWLPGHLDWFAFGMFLAVVVSWWRTGAPARGPLRYLGEHPVISWSVAAFLYWGIQQVRFPTVVGTPPTPVAAMTLTTLIPLAAAFLVAPIALAPDGGGPIRRVLGSRPAVAVGTISYGIYLWHLIAIRQTVVWIADGVLPKSAAIQAALVIAMTAIAATVSYFLVEAPMMRWSARFMGNRVLPNDGGGFHGSSDMSGVGGSVA